MVRPASKQSLLTTATLLRILVSLSQLFFSLALLATQCAAVTGMTKFLLTLNDCHQDAIFSMLKNLSERPSSARFGHIKRIVRTYILVTDGDETVVTAASDPDDLFCADGIDVGTASNRAVCALACINNLQRVPDWKEHTAKLYEQVSVRCKREIYTTHTRPRRLENESVESRSALTGDIHSDHIIRRTRSA